MEALPQGLRPGFLRGAPVPILSFIDVLISDWEQRNNKLVWDETVRILKDLFENVWGDEEAIELDNVMDVTVQVRPPSTRDASSPR